MPRVKFLIALIPKEDQVPEFLPLRSRNDLGAVCYMTGYGTQWYTTSQSCRLLLTFKFVDIKLL